MPDLTSNLNDGDHNLFIDRAGSLDL
jgi:hypothetical protein